MVKLAHTFRSFRPFRALVLGDFMLDTYTTGRVKRVSPEAPVLVMEVLKQESRPGGAGNVVLNLATLGGHVYAVGRIGADAEGQLLLNKMASEGVDTQALKIEPTYQTPVKNRLIADSQQLLRVDVETISSLHTEWEEALLEQLKGLIPKVDVVALSDYGKGFLTPRLIAAAIQEAKKASIPVIVDPKGIEFAKYQGATILKPNLSEAYAAAKLPLSAPLEQVAKQILHIADADWLLITRSEAGISVFDRTGNRSDFPVHSKEVKDVTGAGDTVLATICMALASGLDIHVASQLANIAAGLSIERLGCVQVTLSELARRLLEIDAETKIFDENHTYALHQVLKGRRYALLVLEKEQMMTATLFRTIRELSQKEDQELIIYVRDSHPDDAFIHLLSSLQEVDYIILQTESLKNICDTIHPHEVHVLKGEKVACLHQIKDLITSLMDSSYV